MALNNEQNSIAYSAAGIYAGAAFVGIVQMAIPGGHAHSLVPALAALVTAVVIAAVGPRLPRRALVVLGPLGAAMIALAVSDTHEHGDGAILYVWPALWMAVFFGARGAGFIVVWIGIVHALALLTLPDGQASVDRWIDVEVAVAVVAIVVRVLAGRNERLVQRLADEARSDPLTGLLNRRGFDERMEIELSRAIRSSTSLALVTFDLDHFKRVNDEHGHEAGDRVLTWVGEVIAREVRAIDVAARIGGEEFVVALPDADVAKAHAFAERVRREIGAPESRGRRASRGMGDGLQVTVSGGVACAVAPIDVERLLEDADRALYRAKRAGRDRIVTDESPNALAARPRRPR